jgi:hypothetical protein
MLIRAAEAAIPTHIFSLSERALMEVHQQTPVELFKHNKVCVFKMLYWSWAT